MTDAYETGTYDLIIRGGTVVNHDGAGARDIGAPRPNRGDSARSPMMPPPR